MNYLRVKMKNIHSICRQFHNVVLSQNKVYINGKWMNAGEGKDFPVYNPFTGDVIGKVPDCTLSDLDQAIEGSYESFQHWRNTTAKERSVMLRNLFDLQMKNLESLSKILTLEAGKNINESEGEIKYGASFFEWFSEETRRVYGDIVPSPFKNKQMFFLRQPLGVAGIITPWNFPNAMITRKVGAALAAGCTCIIKPAQETPFSALALAHMAEEAQIPPGVINVVTTSKSNTPVIGKRLCENSKVATISFTGSTPVGKQLLELCSSSVKRVSLELGGNAPFIVFKSANISKAVSGAMASKFRNSGQTCVCTNKFLVQEEVHDEFVLELSKAMKEQLVVGDGMNKKTTLGPLINENAILKVERHVQDALKKGAKLILGGKPHSCGKTFYEPTLLTNIISNMLICSEETFGPVAGVMKFKNEEDAIKIANASKTGLAGYFYSEDISQIWRVAKELEVGMVGANEGIISCAEGAFGGIKESGIGREGSRYGIDEYTYMKYICLGGLE